ncbi:MAG: chromosomal replication initiator protein DnaA [Kiritimatiellales bacterium]|nr:chromosomal replication initiator protein DnaA [Kiritimatiellales bacterium]
MRDECKNIWQEACNQLKNILSEDIYERWIAVIQCREISGNKLCLIVANDFYQSWLEENYLPMIRKAITAISGREMEISLSVDRDSFNFPEKKEKATPAFTPPSMGRKKESNLNPNYVFDSFVVGPSNQFPHAACMAAANTPSRTHNPLFICGGVGLGKTHLMQAIGNHIAAKKPRMKICYTTSEEFVNEYIDALQGSALPQFRKKFRKIDLLMIDDIQFLDGKNRMQEEFFHTFNALFESHKQIVLTSDRTPREMAGLAPRLVSRFEFGLVAELEKPDIETRIAILRKKSELMNLPVAPGVIDFLAARISSNIRSLEGALIRVASYASLTGKSIDLQKLEMLLRDLLDKEQLAIISVDAIQRAVADHYGLLPADILSKKRTQDIAWPRQVAMHLSRTMTDHSFPSIGKSFGRNHATILYAHAQVSERAKEDSSLRQTLSVLKEKVKRNCSQAQT